MANRERITKGKYLKKQDSITYAGCRYWDTLRTWSANKQSRRQEEKLPKVGNNKLFYKVGLR